MKRTPQRGIVLITVLVILAVAMVAFGIAMKSVVREHSQTRLRHEERQCRRLAEAGAAIAQAKLADDPTFRADEWRVKAGDYAGRTAALVKLEVTTNDQGPTGITAIATIPATGTPRVQHQVKIPMP